MKRENFNRLIESANHLVEDARGKRNDFKTTILPKLLPEIKRTEVVKQSKMSDKSIGKIKPERETPV